MPWRSSVIAASDSTLTVVCPEGRGAFWYALLMITYHYYFYGTARIQDVSSTILVTMYYCGYVGVWLVAVHGD